MLQSIVEKSAIPSSYILMILHKMVEPTRFTINPGVSFVITLTFPQLSIIDFVVVKVLLEV